LYAAAGLAVVALSAGIPRLLDAPPPEVARGASATGDAGPMAANGGFVLPPVTSEPLVPLPAAVPPPPSPAVRRDPAPAPGRAPGASPPSASINATHPVAAPAGAPAATAPPAVVPRAVASLRVVHQHRLGSCRGLLLVTRDGVEYQPDGAEHQTKDGFVLPYTRFLSEMSGANLVIKSNDRDYRFRAEAPSNARDHVEQIDAAIAQQR
jgi:hypothetical protein